MVDRLESRGAPDVPASRRAIIAGLVVFVFATLVNVGSLDDWWLNDDPQVLIHAIEHSPPEVLFEPEAWRLLSSSNYTPLITISFHIDYAIFGLDPRGFHLHSILAAGLMALGFFVMSLLVVGARPATAALGACALVASAPALQVTSELMSRHYLIASALMLLALAAWIHSRGRNRWWLAAASFSYFVALLAKEIAALLPFVMIALDLRSGLSVREVAKRLIGPSLAAVGYLLLRSYALGSLGGYGTAARPGETLSAIATGLTDQVVGSLALVVLGLALISVLLVGERRGRGSLAVVGVVALVALGPLVGVAEVAERHLLVPAVALATLAVIGLESRQSLWAKLLGAGILALLVTGSIGTRNSEANAERMRAEGRFVESGRAGVLLAGSPGWYLDGIAELKRIAGDGAPARFVLSRDALILEPRLGLDEVREIARDGSISPLSLDAIDAIERERQRRDSTLRIEIEMTRSGDTVSWRFDPRACECSWIYISLPDFDETRLEPVGARTLPRFEDLRQFVVRRIEDDGRWNVTPRLRLPGSDDEVTRWSSAEQRDTD